MSILLRARRVALSLFAVSLLVMHWGSHSPAVASPSPECVQCPDLSGTWDCGSWTSCTSGHSGRLRARITRIGPNCYRCVFCGTFLKIVPFRYPVTLHVTGTDGNRVYFRASRRLPLFGGTFTCSGSATACSFSANFTSSKDSGTFRMCR